MAVSIIVSLNTEKLPASERFSRDSRNNLLIKATEELVQLFPWITIDNSNPSSCAINIRTNDDQAKLLQEYFTDHPEIGHCTVDDLFIKSARPRIDDNA